MWSVPTVEYYAAVTGRKWLHLLDMDGPATRGQIRPDATYARPLEQANSQGHEAERGLPRTGREG